MKQVDESPGVSTIGSEVEGSILESLWVKCKEKGDGEDAELAKEFNPFRFRGDGLNGLERPRREAVEPDLDSPPPSSEVRLACNDLTISLASCRNCLPEAEVIDVPEILKL